MMRIRPLQRADLEAYGELCRYCFQMTPEYTAVYIEWVKNFLGHSWGAFADGRICAGMWYYPYDMRVGDKFLPMGGVAAVATAPEHRNSGLARTLMIHAHRQMRSEGRPLAVLNPFKHEFYARMGYADAFFYHDCSLAPDQIAPRDVGAYTVRTTDGTREWQVLERLHQEYGAHRFGTVRRDALYWRVRYLGVQSGILTTYIVERGDQPHGYVITHLGKDDQTGRFRLAVIQAVWRDAGSFNAVLQLLRRHCDQVPTIAWRLPVDVPLHDGMRDPKIEAHLKPKMMLKLVDGRAALQLRAYPHDLQGEVVLELAADETSPWNAGRWQILWGGGRARVTRPRGPVSSKSRIRTDSGTLAILYSGRRCASDLSAGGMLAGSAASLALLDRAFPPGTPYIDEWF